MTQIWSPEPTQRGRERPSSMNVSSDSTQSSYMQVPHTPTTYIHAYIIIIIIIIIVLKKQTNNIVATLIPAQGLCQFKVSLVYTASLDQ